MGFDGSKGGAMTHNEWVADRVKRGPAMLAKLVVSRPEVDWTGCFMCRWPVDAIEMVEAAGEHMCWQCATAEDDRVNALRVIRAAAEVVR